MKRKYGYKYRVMEVLVSIMIGLVFGYYLSIIINRLVGTPLTSTFDFGTLTYILLFVVTSFFVYLGFAHPIKVEMAGYVFSIFIIVQAIFWDSLFENINSIKLSLLISAIIIFVVNAFSGYLRWGSAKSYFGRVVGTR